jgi:hypothetical protein
MAMIRYATCTVLFTPDGRCAAAVLAHAFELILCNEVKADYYLPDGTLKPGGTCRACT